ncbi:hypothetical protein [Haloquadratum walsbyi]|jgi:hypothetical protein|uniref:Uncharacterized protein n=1 Tax=Haloquadratum walsbyi (strain DSM 16854 / JCM 12705 / C23) TaxID=768065 RepID=G0LL07_HALWC|nr:hypothetical protein [Haloquadratum walsbyi]CCC40447.1 uncharacterized protein Hqrw_2610 [Haloquadratum walsbyi C23]
MASRYLGVFNRYDLFGKSIPGATLTAGIILISPNDNLPTQYGNNPTLIELVALIAAALAIGLLIGEAIHMFARVTERFLLNVGRRLIKFGRKLKDSVLSLTGSLKILELKLKPNYDFNTDDLDKKVGDNERPGSMDHPDAEEVAKLIQSDSVSSDSDSEKGDKPIRIDSVSSDLDIEKGDKLVPDDSVSSDSDSEKGDKLVPDDSVSSDSDSEKGNKLVPDDSVSSDPDEDKTANQEEVGLINVLEHPSNILRLQPGIYKSIPEIMVQILQWVSYVIVNVITIPLRKILNTTVWFSGWVVDKLYPVFQRHRVLFQVWISSNYDYTYPEHLDRWEPSDPVLARKLDEQCSEIHDIKLKQRESPPDESFYTFVAANVGQNSETLSQRFQNLYSFCRSMWVVFSIILIIYTLSIYLAIIDTDSSRYILISSILFVLILLFLTSTGTYKKLYIKYLISEMSVLEKYETSTTETDQ